MRIVIASPLYPPDIADTAPYVKELALRLSAHNTVTIVTYGHIPEKVSGVKIIAIDKRHSLLVRLFAFTSALRNAAQNADIVYAQNGPSVELPSAMVAYTTRTPMIMHIGDELANKRSSSNFILQIVKRFAAMRARAVISDSPLQRPEILPFQSEPTDALASYERSWATHIERLSHLFHHDI